MVFKEQSRFVSNLLLSILKATGNDSELNKYGVAALASLVGGALAYPLETIKARMAVELGESDAKFKGAVDAAEKIYLKEGLWGFFNGI